jgi:hypothetical protein
LIVSAHGNEIGEVEVGVVKLELNIIGGRVSKSN